MSEKWNIWKPTKDIPNTLYLEELRDTYDGLTLVFKGEDKDSRYIAIMFESALSYRNHDEGDLLKTFDNRGSNEIWPFFIIENSNYLKWFNEESHNIYEGRGVIHYFFVTPNDVIDVLSAYPPIPKWVDSI